jgi:hypothetical protein
MTNRSLWVGSGISGMESVACCILAITFPWPETHAGRRRRAGWELLAPHVGPAPAAGYAGR